MQRKAFFREDNINSSLARMHFLLWLQVEWAHRMNLLELSCHLLSVFGVSLPHLLGLVVETYVHSLLGAFCTLAIHTDRCVQLRVHSSACLANMVELGLFRDEVAHADEVRSECFLFQVFWRLFDEPFRERL